MTPKYDTSQRLPGAQPSTRRTNITYDPGPHPTPVRANPPSMAPVAPEADASGPLTWFIDALGNRVDVTGPPPPDDADDPLIVNRPS